MTRYRVLICGVLICVAVTAMITGAGRGANADTLFMCVFKPPAFITIHDGGMYHGEELLGDLHLKPVRDKTSWSAKLHRHKNAGGIVVGDDSLNVTFYDDRHVTFDDAVGYCSRMPNHTDFGD
jgi:hypothetical protein